MSEKATVHIGSPKSMKISELIEDFDLYPRGDVNSQNISYIAEAMIAGETMPPIVVDQKKRIIDGIHRKRAHNKVNDEDSSIAVIQKTYKTDADAFLDAARLNSAQGPHPSWPRDDGVRLNSFDRAHCALKAASLKISHEDLASALHIAPEKLVDLSGHLHSR